MKHREDTPPPETKENGAPITLPMTLIRWIIYSIVFWGLLSPFFLNRMTVGEWICGALILGWFAGMLNAIINKK